VIRRPDAPAIIFDETVVSYRSLDRRANALASDLRSLGVGRGDLTPVVVHDGFDLVVSIVALMKLGAPFVPIDDLWPASKLVAMVEALRPRAVLHGTDVLAESLPDDVRIAVDARTLPESGRGDFGRPAGMDDLVYGFYTSGSTGEPKCTLNVHRGLLNRFLYMTRQFGGSTDEVALQNSRHVFDSSLWQLLWPLTNGGRVVLPRRDGVLDLSATIATIDRHGVTTTDFVPSIFNTMVEMMLDEPGLADRLDSLRTVLIGGEEINTRAVWRFREMLPDVRIVNTYGPTECSIGSVFHTVGDADREGIPIGRPIDNTYVVVLGEDDEPVAPGTVGEIHIGGDCLGLGYLNDPGRTATAFRVNPFPEIPGDRLYRTGDHGRWSDDGTLLFEGRSDQQVKIGGVRVELSEIELALQTHPRVHEAKVVSRGELDARVLIAFVTCGGPVSEGDLRRHLRRILPPYLVPNRFEVLDRMPLTPNGKTDRKALAAVAESRENAVVVDLQGTERELQEIWHRVMPGIQAGPSDKLFETGGDSLIAQRLALAINAHFGTDFTVRDMVRRPTIASQAAAIRSVPDTAVDTGQMTLDAVLPEDIVPARTTVGAGTPRNVFLTGATGFVGAQLLHDLLCGTDRVVHCLVRADDTAQAQERILANLRHYQLWDPAFAGRLHAVPGDLSAPWLGLIGDRYRHLAGTVDVILHNGAMVNLVREYGAHRSANVQGTIEIARFACTERTTPVHFVSTLSVLPDGGSEAPAPASSFPDDGYSQSKLVGERLMDTAAERGLPVTVHRLGEIMPHSRLGVPSQDGLADLVVRACVLLGAAFHSEITLNYLPVDRASALVTAALDRGEQGYFHLRQDSSVRFDDLLDAFRKTFNLADLPYEDFLDRLRSADAKDRDLSRAATMLPADERDLPQLFSDPSTRCPAERAERLAGDTGVEWPPAGAEVFHNYVSAFARQLGRQAPRTHVTARSRRDETWI
jgi:amino acid adenylation domain-containing protein/thioester reductase-like protein